MNILYPVSILILSLILGIVFFKQCLVERKIYVLKLIYALTLISLSSLIVFVFFKQVEEDEILTKFAPYVYTFLYLLIGLTLAINTKNSISKKFLNDEYFKVIEEEKLYLLIDKSGKIKAASKLFLDNFNGEKKLIGQNFMSVFDSLFSLSAINEQAYKNKDLAQIFDDLKKETTPVIYKRELKVYKKTDNKPYILNFKDHILIENGKYKGHILIGDEKNGEDMLRVEAKLDKSEEDLDNIRLRFAANLELTNEALFFYNLDDNTVWGNDIFKAKLRFSQNTITHDEFIQFIHNEDVNYYEEMIKQLTKENPDYEITYRFKTGTNYNYVTEKGRRLFGSSNEVVGHIEVLSANHFEHSGKNELDQIYDEDILRLHIKELLNRNATFELVCFKFNSIEEINEKYGRKMGNLVMAEYIKALSKNFVENKMLYRLSGLEFAMIITDYRKMTLLEQHLKKGTITNISMRFSSVVISSNTTMGIVMSSDLRARKDLVEAALKALKLAQSEQVHSDYFFYRDM